MGFINVNSQERQSDAMREEQTEVQFSLEKQLRESRALLEISQVLAGTIDLTATLQQIADAATSLIKSADRTILHLLEDTGHYLQPVAVSSRAGDERISKIGVEKTPSLAHRLNFQMGQGIAGIVLESGETINVSDVTTDPRYIPIKEPVSPAFRSLLVAPIIAGESANLRFDAGARRLGTLSVQSPQVGVFTADDVRLLTILGTQAALAIEKAKLYAELNAALDHEKAARAQLVSAEKLAALGRIVASVAHELNNPLQAIQNALYLIMTEETLTPQAREDLQTVLNETDRMVEMIARLRETYRPVTSEEFKPESLNTLVMEVQKLLATHLRRNRIKLDIYADESLPSIPLIRDQVKQVILNISLNAVEAMPDGGVLTIRTEHHAKQGEVLLSVSDTGMGISKHVLPYIFDPFVTTREGGTGLGLAITYDIVRRHNGRIDVETGPGKGSIFSVWLPVEQRFESTTAPVWAMG
jgi:signal transduction histidine kinase